MNETSTISTGFLTKGEAAVILRVSEITVSRLIAAGKLTAHRVGKRVYTTRQAINEYLQNSITKREG